MSQDSPAPTSHEQPLPTSTPAYEAPALRELGTLASLTLGEGGEGADASLESGSVGIS